jgi:uncharacterized membrane protein
MKNFRNNVVGAFFSGLLVVVPTYLAFLLLLRVVQALEGLVQPLAVFIPDWLPRETLLAAVALVTLCVAIGAAVRTRAGRAVMQELEKSVFVRIPGYELFQGLTKQLVGEAHGTAWQPALVEIEDALVPAFIIEELEDGRYTVFVPSVPTPFAGAVYVLGRERVHRVDASFVETFETLARWGSGAKDLVARMESAKSVR